MMQNVSATMGLIMMQPAIIAVAQTVWHVQFIIHVTSVHQASAQSPISHPNLETPACKTHASEELSILSTRHVNAREDLPSWVTLVPRTHATRVVPCVGHQMTFPCAMSVILRISILHPLLVVESSTYTVCQNARLDFQPHKAVHSTQEMRLLSTTTSTSRRPYMQIR